MDSTAVTRSVIQYNQHMVVATADTKGKPWISPLFYMYDEDFNLYWVSDKSALHSRNIRSNPHVAISIFGPASSEEDKIHGVYIDAEATELSGEADIKRAAKIMQQRLQPDKFMIKSLFDITGNAAWRIYKAIPKEISKREDAIDKMSGQTVSIRKKVVL
jgi:uncharacterized protein YhbP (UPF0306 family)